MKTCLPSSSKAIPTCVCEKNNDTVHDFTKDPLKLRIEDGWLKASGTTLGADNANAVVYMMALLARNDLKHPPLECLFTVREEVGLEGALGLIAAASPPNGCSTWMPAPRGMCL